MLWDDNEPFEELLAIEDAEELCRQLLVSPWGWGSSTRHMEAVELLAKVRGTGELPMSFVALMLCTCRRWDCVTTKLIAAVAESVLLDDAELDELAASFLVHEHVISYPLAWVSPQWLEIELDSGNSRTCRVSEDTPLSTVRASSRRCAVGRPDALRSDPARLEELCRGGPAIRAA